MRRLVLLSFFRAQIESRASGSAPNIIYALEEPETSQHPDFQLMIVNALKELSETDNAQVLFTTHNSNLAKEIPKESLRYIYKDEENILIENGTNEDGTDNAEIIDRIIDTLGALPDPKNRVKVLIFVEGGNDVNALVNYSKILNANDDTIINLENNESIAFIPAGGSQLKHYIEKKYLDGLLQSQVHIYDSDVPQYIDSVNALNAEGNPNKVGYNTSLSEMENFLHHEAINEAYYNELGISLNLTEILDEDDVPLKVARASFETDETKDWDNINPDPVKNESKQGKKISRTKFHLNTKVVERMTVERLQERGAFDELRSWFIKINELINDN